jgi:hypothetical protein
MEYNAKYNAIPVKCHFHRSALQSGIIIVMPVYTTCNNYYPRFGQVRTMIHISFHALSFLQVFIQSKSILVHLQGIGCVMGTDYLDAG